MFLGVSKNVEHGGSRCAGAPLEALVSGKINQESKEAVSFEPKSAKLYELPQASHETECPE